MEVPVWSVVGNMSGSGESDESWRLMTIIIIHQHHHQSFVVVVTTKNGCVLSVKVSLFLWCKLHLLHTTCLRHFDCFNTVNGRILDHHSPREQLNT